MWYLYYVIFSYLGCCSFSVPFYCWVRCLLKHLCYYCSLYLLVYSFKTRCQKHPTAAKRTGSYGEKAVIKNSSMQLWSWAHISYKTPRCIRDSFTCSPKQCSHKIRRLTQHVHKYVDTLPLTDCWLFNHTVSKQVYIMNSLYHFEQNIFISCSMYKFICMTIAK